MASLDETLRTYRSRRDYNDPPAVFLEIADVPPLTADCCQEAIIYAYPVAWTRQGGLSKGVIEVSYDDGVSWVHRGDYETESVVGAVVFNASGDRNLGTARPDHWDVFTQITVSVIGYGDVLESKTREEVLAGANLMFIDGEMMAYSTAVEIIDAEPNRRTFVLTDWLRGMRGTPIGDPVNAGGVGEIHLSAVLLSGDRVRLQMPVGDDDTPLLYRARDSRSASAGFGQEFTVKGLNLQPRAVADPLGTHKVNGDWVISWQPVTRDPCPQILSARGVVDADPLTYTVEILDGVDGSAVRTLLATDTDFTVYLTAWQLADFGVPQLVLNARITRTNAWLDSVSVTVET